MTPLQLEISKLLLKDKDYPIHIPATLSDFHRWMNEKGMDWTQSKSAFTIWGRSVMGEDIKYDSSKEFLDQDESILKQIVELIKSN